MLGYKPEDHKEAMEMIEKNISEFRASKAKKSTQNNTQRERESHAKYAITAVNQMEANKVI